MWELYARNAFTLARIISKMQHVGVDPATVNPVAQTLTQLTKCSGGATPQVLRPYNQTPGAYSWGGPSSDFFTNPETRKMQKIKYKNAKMRQIQNNYRKCR